MLGQGSSLPWLRMSPYPYVPTRMPKRVQPLSLRPSLECSPHDTSRPLTNLRMGDERKPDRYAFTVVRERSRTGPYFQRDDGGRNLGP